MRTYADVCSVANSQRGSTRYSDVCWLNAVDVGCSVTCSPAFLMLYICLCFTHAALLMLYLCCVTGLLMLYLCYLCLLYLCFTYAAYACFTYALRMRFLPQVTALLMLYLTQVFELNAVDFGCNVTCSPGGRYVLHEALSY
jgi:hypothetical protein